MTPNNNRLCNGFINVINVSVDARIRPSWGTHNTKEEA
jgi:hypothetical protein